MKKSQLVALIMLIVTAAVIVLQYVSVLPSDRLIRLSNIWGDEANVLYKDYFIFFNKNFKTNRATLCAIRV